MEAQDRAEWERIRWQTCYLLQPHLSKNKTLRPTDLLRFDWEKDTSDIDIDDFLYGGVVFLGWDTPIGPLYVGYGITDKGQDDGRFYLFLGKTF